MIIAIITIFILGYLAITLEHGININKAASALVTGALCWTVYIMLAGDKDVVAHQLTEHLGEISEILFFLLGAMTIVELIDVHDGFNIISAKIKQTNKRKLLWIVSFITFFLSPIIDNLTTTIVMVSLIRKLIQDHEDRLLFTGIVVIASNAGGAWSPIGDVTTTMLWIGGQISAVNIIKTLVLPSIVCMVVPLLYLQFTLKGEIVDASQSFQPVENNLDGDQSTIKGAKTMLFLGVGGLIAVPFFKTVTHLPPYVGMLLSLGVIWIVSELMNP